MAGKDGGIGGRSYLPLLVAFSKIGRKPQLDLIQDPPDLPPDVRWGARAPTVDWPKVADKAMDQFHLADVSKVLRVIFLLSVGLKGCREASIPNVQLVIQSDRVLVIGDLFSNGILGPSESRGEFAGQEHWYARFRFNLRQDRGE